MGYLTMPEYERLEEEALPVETQTGGIEHNESTDLESRTPQFGRQTRIQEAIEPDSTMANDLLDQIAEPQVAAANADGCELDLAFGIPLEEKPIWIDLYESIRDIFFPPKLPPLELTSTPIPMPDRMAVKHNPWAIVISITVNVGLVALAVWLGYKTYINIMQPKQQVTKVDLTDWNAPKNKITAGGGGGNPDNMEAVKGRIPPRAKVPDLTPKVVEPPLPTIDVQKDIIIPDNPTLPNFGMSTSPNVKLGSLGNGSGMGLGSGNGNGYGPGSGWNTGGGLARVGGGVSAPVVIHSVDPEFSDEARRAKYQGVCIVELIVDAQGNPQNPHVTRALGMGLDEKAIDAIKQFKFKPAFDRNNKKAVAVMVSIEINFRLY
jgi:TonB family protein